MRSIVSRSVGMESSWVLILAHASSTRSIALSGSCRPEMYLSLNFAASTSALSCMWTPWNVSKRSFSPRSMETVVSTSGSATYTLWKRRSSAGSFSMYCLYSSRVVAPTQRSSPRASMGFSMLEASIDPSVLPAPTMVCSSSMNRITLPSLSLILLRTAFKRSSNSPRYFAPAMSAPMSSAKTVLSFRPSGTSRRTMRWARPSAMAVLPTPGSPINTGLFFVFRERILMTRLISSSRPITGSSFPSRASFTKSAPYFSSTS